MKIVQLTAENVKRISAVTITPKGAMTVIGGDHGAGKSTALDSIMYALGGKKFLPPKPLREGAEAGKIEVKLDGDEARGLRPMTVTRTFAANGRTELKITTADGFAAPSPQAILSDLFNEHTFDPLAFTRLPPKQQAEQLRALVGLDFAELDRQRKTLFDDRTTINREAKSLKARLDVVPWHDEVPSNEIAIADLITELRRRQAVNEQNAEQRREVQSHANRLGILRGRCRSLDRQIVELQKELAEAQAVLDREQASGDAQEATVASLQDLAIDECQQQIEAADETNRKVRTNAMRKTLWDEHAGCYERAEALTEQIKQIDADKAAQLQAAQWPVEGLGFDDTGVTFKGLPIQQINTAELIRISVAIGFALNPGLPTLLIRDGSLMTLERLQLIGELAEEYGGQLFVERVGDGAECSVIIEDGHVRQ